MEHSEVPTSISPAERPDELRNIDCLIRHLEAGSLAAKLVSACANALNPEEWTTAVQAALAERLATLRMSPTDAAD